MKMTAVDWLQYEINYCKEKNGVIELTQGLFDSLIEQAKEMEKEQIENAFRIGATTELTFGDNKAEQYYIKEYGGEQ